MPTPVILGADDQSVTIGIIDNAAFTAEEGVTSATSGLALWWKKGETGAKTALSLSDLANHEAAHSDGGIAHIDDGMYRVCLPDSAVPTIENEVTKVGGTATGMIVLPAALVGVQPIGAPAGASIAADLAAIEAQTDDIGAAGAGLSGVPWNAAWDAEVQSEVADALAVYAPATVGAAMTLASGAITAAVIATDAIDADALAASAVAEIAAGGSGASPQTFWEYSTRTLTQGAASVVAAVTGTSVTQYRGTRWSITLTGLTDMTGQTGVWFGVKANGREDVDTASICLVKTTTGLIAFDGDDTITAGHAAITVNSSTSITITVEADATQYATPGQYEYAVKALNASGKPFMVSSGGSFNIVSDIPMAIS